MNLEIYKEHILDLYRNPHNKGNLKNPTYEFSKNNPICGDEIKIQIITEKDKIKDIRFSGEGCAISQASASMLTDKIKNMPLKKIKNLVDFNSDFHPLKIAQNKLFETFAVFCLCKFVRNNEGKISPVFQ